MNDFTKEELDEIKGWADYSVGSGLCHTETEPLYTKIQSMIDNYDDDKTVKDALNYIVLKARDWKLKL